MARSRRDGGSRPQEFEEGEGQPGAASGRTTPSRIIQFDPERERPRPALILQSVDAASTVRPEEGLLAAKEEIKRRMGGFPAVAAAAAATRADGHADMENIVGWAVGEKRTGPHHTGEMAVLVYVVEKLPRSRVEASALVPEQINGYPTDVVEVGEIQAQGFMSRYPRPVPGGSSVGHYQITAGTLGGLVVLENNRLCLLSNNHVLADANDAAREDPILQPGPADGGRNPQDRLAILEDFVPLRFESPNKVDAAVAWTTFRHASPHHHSYTINPDPVEPSLHMTVRKCGRTTGHTLGDITGLSADIRVRYQTRAGTRIAEFWDQIQIRGRNGVIFSRPGDSGSLIVTAGSKQPVGLLFAGGDQDTFANPIGEVMAALRIDRFLAEAEE